MQLSCYYGTVITVSDTIASILTKIAAKKKKEKKNQTSIDNKGVALYDIVETVLNNQTQYLDIMSLFLQVFIFFIFFPIQNSLATSFYCFVIF